jgi:hypothetical protein
MAIIQNLLNPTPMLLNAMACAQEVEQVTKPPQPPQLEFCICGFQCDYVEIALAKDGGEDWENDYSSFLIQLPIPSSTASFTLKKGSTEFPIVDDTYGDYFPLGSISGHPLKTGFIIRWDRVFTLEGGGIYTLEVEQTNFGSTTTTESHKFDLNAFSETRADGTVRLDTIKNGQIEGGLDYTGMNWPTAVRLQGKFGDKQATLETDNYVNPNRRTVQIQDQVTFEYSLQTSLIPDFIINPIFKDDILSNEILISDYNIYNHENFKLLPVYPVSFDDATYFRMNTNGVFSMTFTDKVQNLVKRNNF